MIWIIIAIVVIVIIVNSNKKKKQQQQGQQPPQTGTSKPASKAATTAAASSARAGSYTGSSKGAPPPKAGDKLDQAAFARAFAHMSGDAPQGGPSKAPAPETPKPAPAAAPKSAPAPSAAPKVEPAKSSAPPKVGDKLDQAAFARAFAHMSGDAPQGGPSKAPAPEAPKSAPAAPPKPEAPKSEGDPAALKQFHAKILSYYHNLWNKDTGSLYTELASMPIHHFGVQAREDRLVESVWLEGDDIPLVSETEYAKLCGDDKEAAGVIPLTAPQQTQLMAEISGFLLYLKTVEVRDGYFYPLKPGQAPTGSGAPTGGAPSGSGAAPAGKAAQGFSQSDKEAQLRAQIQAMMEKQKKDNPPKK